MRVYGPRSALALAIVLTLALPLAAGDPAGGIVDDRVVSHDPVSPIAAGQTQCGGTAPLPDKTECVTVFRTGATLTTAVIGCYTGDITITFRDVDPKAYPKVTRRYLLNVVCGEIVSDQMIGSLYANRVVSATAETESLYGLVQIAGLDPGVGPWAVRYTF